MIKKSAGLAVVLSLLLAVSATGQDSLYTFSVQTLGGYTTPGVVPFWLRSNQFGSIPLDGASLSLIGAARKDYDLSGDKLFDWGASFEGRANLGEGSNLTLIEGYGKARLGIFELRAGRSKKITGLSDTTLSSGSWAISGTGLGIPEVDLSIRNFFLLPWTGQLFAIKGSFSHGWIGEVSMRQRGMDADTINLNAFLHQLSFYGRFGKPSWKLKVYAGLNHLAFWGSEQNYYNEDFTLSHFSTFLYVITGKRYNNGSIQAERLGNHLGSIDIGFNYDFNKILLSLYRQNIYDVGALGHLANIQDGLNGFSLHNKHIKENSTSWRNFLFEVLYTKNQAGEPFSAPTPSPYEPYYNHVQYINGWSFQGIGLGTPFITTRKDAKEGLPYHPYHYFINNRVIVLHLGLEGTLGSLNYRIKGSWSKNYGTYATTDDEQTTDIPNPGAYGIFGMQKQLSTYFEINKPLRNGYNIGFISAYDRGTLLYNSFGLFMNISYSFNL